jgi:hypothetical protein
MDIERIGPITAKAFHENYGRHRKPIVMKSLAAGWKCLDAWTLDRLRERVGEMPVAIQQPEGDGQFHYRRFARVPFHEFLDDLVSPTPKGYYLTTGNPIMGTAGAIHHELAHDFVLPDFIPTKNVHSANLWIGPAGTRSVLHHDIVDNLVTMIQGRKSFLLLAP